MQLKTTAKRLFLVDAIGALVTIFFLGIVLVQLQSYVGMPKAVLYVLVIAPCIFAVYSFSCYFFLKSDWGKYLKVVALGNLSYCVATIYLMYCHFEKLTTLGLVYFLGEIVVIIVLVYFELQSASRES